MKKVFLLMAAVLLAGNTLWGQAPVTAEDFFGRGNTHATNEDYDLAIADFNQAIRLDPNHVDAYFNRGIAHALKLDFDMAVADWETVLKLDPDNADAMDFIESVEREQWLWGKIPVTAEDFFDRGNTFLMKSDYEQAITDFSEAIRLDPNYVDAYFHRGAAYAGNNEIDLAIADIEALLLIDPDNEFARIFYEAIQQNDSEAFDEGVSITVRGLKRVVVSLPVPLPWSHSARVRGLKPSSPVRAMYILSVALRASYY
jgi:tetratricopeptide (TPR) repeat protein